MRKSLGIIAAIAAVALGASISTPSMAATAGNGDVSDAMRYDIAAPFGTELLRINGDDTRETIAAAFPINFFGVKYDAICITDNGGVFPVLTTADTCTNSYDKNVENLAIESKAPMVAALASDLHPGSDECVALQADTTFGNACKVYAGTTTIDGREAMVFTWYRIPMYNGYNPVGDFATFQILLIKNDTTNGSSVGYNFDFEFNFGTVNDVENGYSAEDPATSCDQTTDISNCRWGVGVANYSTPGVADGVATGYEFFAAYSIDRLVDGGNFSLVTHNLNTTLPGRYTCSMVDGVATGCDAVAEAAPELPNTGVDAQLAAGFAAAAVALLGLGVAFVAIRRRVRA